MIDTETIQHLSVLSYELNTMPYGVCTRNRVLPPNRFHYARLFDEVCEIMISLDKKEFNEVLKNLLSIRDNQVRELLLKNDNVDFQIFGIDEKMSQISRMISMHLSCLLSNENR